MSMQPLALVRPALGEPSGGYPEVSVTRKHSLPPT